MQVLILNQNYEAVSVTDETKAFLLVWLNKAEMLESYDNLALKTVTRSYPVPSIIKLKRYVAIPYRTILLSRKNVLRRDNHRCQYCQTVAPDLTVDHVIPRAAGGQDSWENLVAACRKCNHKKGNRTPEQAGMKLLNKPFKPNYVLFLRQNMVKIHEKWKPYLFLS